MGCGKDTDSHPASLICGLCMLVRACPQGRRERWVWKQGG
jgi:hypothetical protein